MGASHTYPITRDIHHRVLDLSQLELPEAHNCEKFYFTTPNKAGWCGIEHTDTGEQLLYKYDPDPIPYLGVWKTQGGYRGDYTLALKPCTGVYDDLYLANKIRRCSTVKPKGEPTWAFKMVVK